MSGNALEKPDKPDKLATIACVNPENKKLYQSCMLLQEKWVLFIVLSLLEKPLGFNEISRKAANVNTTTLSQRLSLLEAAGLVTRMVHCTIPPRTSYELTEAGRGLESVIAAIRDWGERFLDDGKVATSDCS